MVFGGNIRRSFRGCQLETLGKASEKAELAGILILQHTRPRSHQLLSHRPFGALESPVFEIISLKF